MLLLLLLLLLFCCCCCCLALQQLEQFSSGPNSPLTGVEPTIKYLQNLGAKYIDVILENSQWVIKVSGCGFSARRWCG